MDEANQTTIVPDDLTWHRRQPLIGDAVTLNPGTTYALAAQLSGAAGLRMAATDGSILVAFTRRNAREEWVEVTFSVQSPTDAIMEWVISEPHGLVREPTLERR